MNKSYEISTIKDVFNKVPTDRIRDCLNELGVLLSQAAAMRDMIKSVADATGVEYTDDQIAQLPDVFTWEDDGKGELSLNIGSRDEHGEFTSLASINTVLESKE